MTRVWCAPDSFVDDSLTGFCELYAEFVRRVPGGVARSTGTPPGKVAVVIGGGSGHYPAFSGYVGRGLADAAVVGNVFASPSAQQIGNVARAVAGEAGVMLAFGNYAGDVLNFGLAAERLRADGIETEVLAVSDDIASAPSERAADRRGVAGDVVVFKVIGAAAEAGYDLSDVARVAGVANDRTRSLGVAFTGCTLPGATCPLFTVPVGRMGVVLGIHGEPGIAEEAVLPADELARLLVDRVLVEAPADASGRAVVLLNGLGSTKYEELFLLWRQVSERLRGAGVEIVRPEAGELVTSLDMAGCSLTLSWLDDETMQLWGAAVETPALRRGIAVGTPAPASPKPAAAASAGWPAAGRDSAAAAARIAGALGEVSRALGAAEQELGRLDAHAGDGDHGSGMKVGSEAAAEAAAAASAAGAGAASTLAAAADAWADRAGGTSGALWGVALRAGSGALSDESVIRPADVARAGELALDAVVRLGGAKQGDKTLVDALEPFVREFAASVRNGASMRAAWRRAADAATRAAEATAALEPRLGRARPLAARSLGHPDPGAVSLALCARTVADAVESAELTDG